MASIVGRPPLFAALLALVAPLASGAAEPTNRLDILAYNAGYVDAWAKVCSVSGDRFDQVRQKMLRNIEALASPAPSLDSNPQLQALYNKGHQAGLRLEPGDGVVKSGKPITFGCNDIETRLLAFEVGLTLVPAR